MKRLAAAAVLVASLPAAADAHRLDEYLQAARVAVAPAGVVVFLDLTPGVSIAPWIIDMLDHDDDGRVSPAEAGAYGRMVMGEIEARLDGAPLPLVLRRVEVPTPGEMREGEGTIRMELGAPAGVLPGRHLFEMRNNHRSAQSVYLANALAPDSGDVTILRQERDPRQQTFRLHYATQAASTASALWLLAGVAGLALHARWRLAGVGRPAVSAGESRHEGRLTIPGVGSR